MIVPWPLTRAQQQVLGRSQLFAREQVAPVADACDAKRRFPPAILAAFHKTEISTKFLAPRPDDDFATTAALVTEELAYACASFASYLMLPVFFNRAVAANLPLARGKEHLERCLKAPVVTSFAASERDAGSDLLAMSVRAERTPDGYRLTGRKEYSSNLRQARYVIVVARTRPGTERTRDAHSWFLVPTDAKGVRIGPRWPTFGLRAMDLSPLELDGVEIPRCNLLGEEGKGLAMMADHLSQSRAGIAAVGIGIARRARDLVIEHSRRRRLFGEKLAHQQDYRFRIAEMERDIAAARALVWLAAAKSDRGEDATREASVAKLFAGDMVMRITTAASAMLGSVGYTAQTPVEKLVRDARHVAIVEGPEPVHKEIIFAHLLRRGGY